MVWACNLCDMGLDSSIEMQEHMQSYHDRAVNIVIAEHKLKVNISKFTKSLDY